MPTEKPEPAVDFTPFVDGFLNDKFASGVRPDYGYHENHLPDTTGSERQMESILALVDWAQEDKT